jgi:hypothetical protein
MVVFVIGLSLALNAGAQTTTRKSASKTRKPASATRPGARWLGQDGRDLVGPSPKLEPSDVQDIHVSIRGLPANKQVVRVTMKGHGGSQWDYNGPYGSWKAVLEREEGSTTADFYAEPDRQETGRPFTLTVIFDDGSNLELSFPGGKADPNLRIAGKSLQADWKGQKRVDHVGASPNVGPDGIPDAVIALSQISPKIEVKSIRIDAKGLPGWCYGVNPDLKDNAELIRAPGDLSKGDLVFQPTADLIGKTLTIEILYANEKIDRATVKAGRVSPKARMPKVAVANLPTLPIKATWIGQEPGPVVGHFDVHVLLEGLPRNLPIAALAMSNAANGVWSVRLDERVPFVGESYSTAMAFRPRADGTSADLYFPPDRDESGENMYLRIVFANGKQGIAVFPGGPANVGLRAGPGPAGTEVVAKVGDDLNTLADKFGTITLTKGVYKMATPLVLNNPITIRGEQGAVIQFEQSANDAPWSAAIKIHSGHTTLESFAIRFAGPVRWNDAVNYSPAVIGTTDNFDQGHNNLKADLNFRGLDIEGPPQGPGPKLENAVNLMRLFGAFCGSIERNTLRGGMIEFFHGPWKITQNTHTGTIPHTGSQSVMSCHNTHDVVIRDNVVKSVGESGKTWRFLVMTGMGFGDLVEGNRIEDVGPRDADTLGNANAPETILTENYCINFEGKLLAVSPDRRVVKVPYTQGDPARTGCGLAILTGPQAGQWRRVVHAIDETTYLLDSPLPPDVDIVSIALGFIKETYANNRIDARGSSSTVCMVFPGNHFGVVVQNNHFLGAGQAFQMTGCPTTRPGIWGWTHSPLFGGVIEGNRIEDSARGGFLAVWHDSVTKTNSGRVYMSANVVGNTAVWTSDFLARNPRRTPEERAGLVFGDKLGKDPASLILSESDNHAQGLPGAVIHVEKGRINGKVLENVDIPLAPENTTAGKALR